MKNQMIISCIEDNKFEQDRQIAHSCNSSFPLEDSKVFYVETLYYDDEILGQYYTLCPNCGYIVLLDENNLSDTQKLEAQERYKSDPLQYKKNSLLSQLINLESRTPRMGTKVRVRAIY